MSGIVADIKLRGRLLALPITVYSAKKFKDMRSALSRTILT